MVHPRAGSEPGTFLLGMDDDDEEHELPFQNSNKDNLSTFIRCILM